MLRTPFITLTLLAACSTAPQSQTPDLFSDPRYAVVEASLPQVCDMRRMRSDQQFYDMELRVTRETLQLPVRGPDIVVGLDEDTAPIEEALVAYIAEHESDDMVFADFRVVTADDVPLQQLIRGLELAPPQFERAVVASRPEFDYR